MPASRADDVREFYENNPDATNKQAAEALDCSESTVQRHKPESVREASSGTETEQVDPEDAQSGEHVQGDLEGEPADLRESDLDDQESDDDGDQESDDEPADADLDDGSAKDYTCGNCGAELSYLQKECECGAEPAWSALDAQEA